MKAVHFGAGNIGRGFVGLILHDAGYEVVFADVDAGVIDALAAAPSYQVHEVGAAAKVSTVDNYRALNSRTDERAVIDEIATAEIVTTAVGANILKFVAPLIAAAILARPAGLAPLTVMACENALNATDLLEKEVRQGLGDHPDDWVRERATFANTAVDRIVPQLGSRAGLDVTVEDFFEWAIESRPFGDSVPDLPGAHFVDDLDPYIERKLFTVNTGHATVAYHGFLRGAESLAAAVAMPEVLAEVRAVLDETSALLVAKYGFDPAEHGRYVDRTLVRFANPQLPDTPARVGRQPLRKLGRNERFVSPAAQLAQRGGAPVALVRAIGAALRFDLPEDPESVRMLELLHTLPPEEFTTSVTGLVEGEEPYAAVVEVVRAAHAARGASV